MKSSIDVPKLKRGTRFRLTLPGHRQSKQQCTILAALLNPSRRAEHQWYDVRFETGSFGRFLEKYLAHVEIPVSTHCATDLVHEPRRRSLAASGQEELTAERRSNALLV